MHKAQLWAANKYWSHWILTTKPEVHKKTEDERKIGISKSNLEFQNTLQLNNKTTEKKNGYTIRIGQNYVLWVCNRICATGWMKTTPSIHGYNLK